MSTVVTGAVGGATAGLAASPCLARLTLSVPDRAGASLTTALAFGPMLLLGTLLVLASNIPGSFVPTS